MIIDSWDNNLDPQFAIKPNTWFNDLIDNLIDQEYCFEYGVSEGTSYTPLTYFNCNSEDVIIIPIDLSL